MKTKLLFALLVLSLLGLSACTTAAPAFEDIEWGLESYGEKGDQQSVLKDSEITATFKSAEGKVDGSAGCNGYFAEYEAKGDKLTIGMAGSTMMFCEGFMDQEQEYLKILGAAESYQIQDGKLQISSGSNLLIFKRR